MADEERLVFLIPAHDEGLLIERCVKTLLSIDYPESRRRVVVVADNCEDDTASRARFASYCRSIRPPNLDWWQSGRPSLKRWSGWCRRHC